MATRGRPAAKRTTASKTKPERDVTQYADKVPTGYHKTFAKWAVEEVGYKPTNRKDFLMGIAIATAARPVFTASQYLADWREEAGEAKRGPKTNAEKTSSAKAKARKAAPEPEPEEDEWTQEDVDERQEELEGLTVVKLKAFAKNECEATAAELKKLVKKSDVVDFILDYEFPEDEEGDDEDEDEEESDEEDEDEDSEEDDDDYDEDDEEEEDDEDDDEDEEPEPPKRGRGRPSSAKSSARTTQRPAAKAKSGAGAKSGNKSDYLF